MMKVLPVCAFMDRGKYLQLDRVTTRNVVAVTGTAVVYLLYF